MKSDETYFDIRFDEGGFGGFPTPEKAVEFLRAHPDDYKNIRLVQVSYRQGRMYSVEVPFAL